MGKKILIVDDDNDISMIIGDTLCSCGYQADTADECETAYDMLGRNKYDLIILDVNLPGESGLDLCQRLRKLSSVPIIFISAMDSEEDRILGLDIGGDDYISKPFSIKELTSRVNSLMRRTYGESFNQQELKIGDIVINPSARTVIKRGNEVKLSMKEFDVLLYLAKNKNCTVKKHTLLNEVWGMFSESEASTLSVHIRWLREKLEDNPAKPKYIKTIWGVGFSLCDGEKE